MCHQRFDGFPRHANSSISTQLRARLHLMSSGAPKRPCHCPRCKGAGEHSKATQNLFHNCRLSRFKGFKIGSIRVLEGLQQERGMRRCLMEKILVRILGRKGRIPTMRMAVYQRDIVSHGCVIILVHFVDNRSIPQLEWSLPRSWNIDS